MNRSDAERSNVKRRAMVVDCYTAMKRLMYETGHKIAFAHEEERLGAIEQHDIVFHQLKTLARDLTSQNGNAEEKYAALKGQYPTLFGE